MNVLVVGSGGREHAMVWKLAQDPSVTGLHCIPGNPGIAQLAECHPEVGLTPDNLLAWAVKFRIDLTVIGPEAPLVIGVVDTFRASGQRIVGPTRAQAQLEGSKVFAKRFFTEHRIPTARFAEITASAHCETVLDRTNYPVVIKADGLAAGKGVIIASNRQEAEEAILRIGFPAVVEEFLSGEEVSFIALSDGQAVTVFEPCQDHKRIFDGDQGPNTGGMGAYCDSRILSSAQRDAILERIILPTIRATGFAGFLYAGLMMTDDGPKLLEYNVRLGDPEAQCILHRMVADFGQVLLATANSRLKDAVIQWRPEPSVCVVMAAAGYPGTPRLGDRISGIAEAGATGAEVFQAGTRTGSAGLETAGGRVLGVTARGADLPQAMAAAYRGVEAIHFSGAQFRLDIASKGLSRWPDPSLK